MPTLIQNFSNRNTIFQSGGGERGRFIKHFEGKRGHVQFENGWFKRSDFAFICAFLTRMLAMLVEQQKQKLITIIIKGKTA